MVPQSSLSSIAVIIGISLFLLAGYQTLQNRDMMKLRQEEHVVLPAAVLIEVLVAAALCMIGSLGLAGDLKPIYATANQEGVDMDVFRPDFMAFNHRGYALPLAVDSISGSSGSSSLKKNKDQ